MKSFNFLLDEQYEGERLDKGLSLLVSDGMSRSYLQKIIKGNGVYVNGKVQKSSYLLRSGDEIAFEVEDNIAPDIVPQDIPLNILYEDEDVIVVNKPKDMVVHPAYGHYSDTLVNALMFHCKDSLSGINGVLRPGIVHRIDKDTTGSVIACKNDIAHEKIAKQLSEHTITRRYRAIVCGVIKNDEGTVDYPIGRDVNDRKKMSIKSAHGKEAVTHYKVLERFRDYTYIECVLETGRTHQIRVHMSSIGFPILGDEVYGRKKCPFDLKGQCLHAYILGFVHPTTSEYIETVAPLPVYFEDLLVKLRSIK